MRTRLLKARTPDEVFYDPDTRIARRDPDESFGFMFFDPVNGGRVVGNNGVRHEGRVYRLASLQKHLEYWGERVDVRVNPDDQSVAMIFDRLTGTYLCKAFVDREDATYDTRDEVTRNLIARVFSDGKQLLRMAQAHVEGAKERLVEYRRAKIEYLVQRNAEHEKLRTLRQATLDEGARSVTVIGSLSAVSRESAAMDAELTATAIADILEADERRAETSEAKAPSAEPEALTMCAVSTRKRKPKTKTGRPRRDGALSYGAFAKRHGTTTKSLERYRLKKLPWPDEEMREEFEKFERLRSMAPEDAVALLPADDGIPAKQRRTRAEGELSYANFAKAIGIHIKTLERCRQGKRPWPPGAEERFRKFERQRMKAATVT